MSPTLAMLWESDDPHEALRTRFGFADAEAAGAWAVEVLEREWGIRADHCERVVMSDRNALAWIRTGGTSALLKWCVTPERFERLALAADLTAWLGARGLPVSAPVPTPDGRVQVRTDDVSMSLQRVVDGAHLDVDDPEQVHAAGAALARLHRAMVTYPGTAGRHGVLTPPPAPAELVAGWLDTAPATLSRHAHELLRSMLATAPEAALPLQVVQGDYRAANVLCADDRVVAVLDFEELRLDHRVVELARSAVMLGTLFRDWGSVSEAVRQRFLDGYRSVEALTPDELRWWDVLVLWYSLALVPPGDDPTGWGRAADEHLARIRSR